MGCSLSGKLGRRRHYELARISDRGQYGNRTSCPKETKRRPTLSVQFIYQLSLIRTLYDSQEFILRRHP